MRRVMIVGCCGSGKSTLAARLRRLTGLPVIHLDQLFWQEGWVEAAPELFLARLDAAIAGETWITDGNHSRTMDRRLARADTFIWLDYPLFLCLARIFWRILTTHGQVRPDMAEGCPEKFDWEFLKYVWNFPRTHTPRTEALLAKYTGDAAIIRLKGPRQTARWLKGLQSITAPVR